MRTDSAIHYDQITDYMYWTNLIKNGGRIDPSFHKIIKVPSNWKSANPKELKSNYLYDVILSIVPLPIEPLVLDAGCGFGGLIFWFYRKHPGIYHGISSSSVQINYARKLAGQVSPGDSIVFETINYDAKRNYRYDVITAVESLLHSPNLSITIENLSACLKKGGKLVIIEDMISSDKYVTQQAGIEILQEEWSINHFPTHNQYKEELSKNGLELIVDIDLSPLVQLIDQPWLQLMKKGFKLLSNLPGVLIQKIACFHMAQMILHEMYHNQTVQYRLLVASK